jgi:hypothetical protein
MAARARAQQLDELACAPGRSADQFEFSAELARVGDDHFFRNPDPKLLVAAGQPRLMKSWVRVLKLAVLELDRISLVAIEAAFLEFEFHRPTSG